MENNSPKTEIIQAQTTSATAAPVETANKTKKFNKSKFLKIFLPIAGVTAAASATGIFYAIHSCSLLKNHGGDHFAEFNEDLFYQEYDEGLFPIEYRLKLKDVPSASSTVKVEYTDHSCDLDTYDVYPPINPRIEDGCVVFSVDIRKKSGNSKTKSYKITGTFNVKITLIDDSKELWSDTIQTFRLAKIMPDKPDPEK